MGTINFLGWLEEGDALYANVHSKGFFKGTPGGASWTRVEDGLGSALLDTLKPGAVPVPQALARASA